MLAWKRQFNMKDDPDLPYLHKSPAEPAEYILSYLDPRVTSPAINAADISTVDLSIINQLSLPAETANISTA